MPPHISYATVIPEEPIKLQDSLTLIVKIFSEMKALFTLEIYRTIIILLVMFVQPSFT
jgi:hypothetical protein